MSLEIDACPCGSAKLFSRCCGRFLVGDEQARTPEQLMRSRYSAYAIGGFGDYLLQTWFPATARGLTAADLSQRSFEWLRLEVIAKSQSGDNGEVEFRAYFRESDAADARHEVMHECSAFKRIRGRWYYVGGRVS